MTSAEAKRETLYDALVKAGVPIDSHESDLYVLDTPEARDIMVRHIGYTLTARRFRSNIDGKTWIDVPFAYLPWWRNRAARAS